ncbi:MAG TPA: PAS domain S-box protein, partial [Burkholderiaceae bacterium]|nr:PAS domain S-box protein [Burkholderiaceae bacterium]
MPDNALNTCLELCRRARDLKGAPQAQALTDLQDVLEKLTSLLPQEEVSATSRESIQASVPESNRQPLIKLDPTGYLTAWSVEAEQMFGYTEAEVIGQHVLILYADDDEEIAELFLDEGTSMMEVRRRKKSGEVFRAALSLKTVHDAENDPIGLEIFLTEIYDRLSDQDKLRLHARIIEDSDQGILITDANERIVSINRAFSRITGYSPMEAIGQTPDLLRSGLHDANFRAEVRDAMRGSGPWQGEIVGRRKNGELFPQSVTISVVRNEDNVITHAFSIFSDISRHKEAEARLQKLANYDTVT